MKEGDRTHRLGRFEIVLPAEHRLDQYQRAYRLYDRFLGDIANLVGQKYPDATAIDIGANVGDSAAAICRDRDLPVLCIEGSPTFLPYLRENRRRLPAGIEVVECLVSSEDGTAPADYLKAERGTASIGTPGASPAPGPLVLRRLDSILKEHPRFLHARLVKSDTDGADFDILIASLPVFRHDKPVLYFEYDPTVRKDGHQKALALIAGLVRSGYGAFAVYDNFGHFLEVIDTGILDRFADLDRYLMSNLFFGRHVYYLDVCAFAKADYDIKDSLVSFHRQTIDEHMRKAGWHV